MHFDRKKAMNTIGIIPDGGESTQEKFLIPGWSKCLALLVFTGMSILSGCGGSGSSSSQANGQLSGNWQFTMTAPSDGSFLGGLQGGFLLQTNSSVAGAVVYTIQLPPSQPGGLPTLCNSGSGPVTGTINAQSVNLTIVAVPQTFVLTGTLSSDGTTMMGTYTSTDGQGCGTAQSNLQWSAMLVPSVSGTIQGNLHSVLDPALQDQDFPFTGFLTQGSNIGASNATVTGNITFQGYPCLASASVNGQISGSSLILQIIAPNGLNAGQIGAPVGYSNPSPVSVVNTSAGIVVRGTNGYGVTTKSCPGGNIPGDVGNICMAVGNSSSCSQPITLSPPALSFVPQQVGSMPTTQTITLTNSGSAPLSGATLSFNPQSGATDLFGLSDFDGLPNFAEQDNCSTQPGSAFNLSPQQSCTITISFSPQQSCPWLPSIALGGEPPTLCPFLLNSSITVNSPLSADNDKAFAVPITGLGFSAIFPSVGELDFGAEALGESSAPQTLTLSNQGANPVQILPALSTPCTNPKVGGITLPARIPGVVAGLQVDSVIQPNPPTINYNCDSDLTSKLPNFQISSDNCSGTILAPQASCSVQVTFVPQPSTPLIPALDYFLELNTLQCTSTTTVNCEIDSGRFPVEIKANTPSPLRMTPGAGLDFGTQPLGQTTNPLAITIYNDPKDPNAGPVTFTGNVVQGSNFSENDTCSGTLASGASCTINVSFEPSSAGFTSGTLTIGYGIGQIQTIYLRGVGQ